MFRIIVTPIIITMLLTAAAFGAGKGVVGSKHDLSVSGQGAFVFDEIRVCVFCHTPHNAQPTTLEAPLWNRALPPEGQVYQMYDSPKFGAAINRPANYKPTGASRVCLSCHDGTLALFNYGGTVLSSGAGSTSHTLTLTGTANLSTDLRNDHPISFPYPENSLNFAVPSSLTGPVKLDGDGYLQCTSCHNPHDNEFGKFLVMDNAGPTSPLCVTCHIPPVGGVAAHNTGDGCMNCHTTHNAAISEYLLKAPVDQSCFVTDCHSGDHSTAPISQVGSEPVRVAGGPVQALWSMIRSSVFLAGEPDRQRRRYERGADLKTLFDGQIYRHPIGQSPGTHSRKEQLPMRRPHVECVDCHNAHLAGGPATPGGLKSSLKGASGIGADSMTPIAVTREYEICNKCHSGGAAGNFVALRKTNRMIREQDQMRRFRASNPSVHPVAIDRRGNGDSLLDEFRSSMIRIDCSDCHNSDSSKKAGGNGPNGPHASRYEHILIARYDMPAGDGRSLSGCSDYRAAYDLCFRCHSNNYVMATGTAFANGTVNEHARHVVERCIPCGACHDPHGVPVQGGATAANNAHLINFDRGYAAGRSVASPIYISLGGGRGSCTVNCHVGATHSYAR
jgi:predicted CXXCH cytochrome family protein